MFGVIHRRALHKHTRCKLDDAYEAGLVLDAECDPVRVLGVIRTGFYNVLYESGIIEPMKLSDESDLVKKYKTQLEAAKGTELPVMSGETWLNGFAYWNPHSNKLLEGDELDWSSK